MTPMEAGRTIIGRRWLVGLLLVLLWALGGCAALPTGVERPPSTALTPTQARATTLGRIAADSSPDASSGGALSGFRLLPAGPFALTARLQLMRRAERTLDLQYYHLYNDEVGRLMLRELRDAARRGVRVRLLVDDLYTADIDDLLRAFAAHSGVQVRLFNPFPAGRSGLGSRFLASALDFGRVNHRMHNKMLVADGSLAVTGGRNLGSEYFMRAEGDNFVDLDTLVAGAIVPRMNEIFDDYWNSPFAFPIEALVPGVDSPAALRATFDEAIDGAGAGAARLTPLPMPTADPLGHGPITQDLEAGRLDLIWASAEVHADPPGKIVGMTRAYGLAPLTDVISVRYNVLEAMRQARQEIVITSPYLVPGERGMRAVREARERGVALTLVTNSLATNDEPLVHVGYRRYRRQLLEAGVDLYEFSPLRIQRVQRLGLAGTTRFRLHSKTAVIDREVVYIGSMNFDPRSEVTNTEMGLIIRSPELAREMLRLAFLLRVEGAYRVVQDERGRLMWRTLDDSGEFSVDTEPETNLLMRLWLELLSPLAIEELL